MDEVPDFDAIARPAVMPTVRGRDVVDQMNAAKALRDAGEREDALDLMVECCAVAKSVGWRRISPSWAWDSAALARKLRRFDLEVEVLLGYVQVHRLESAVSRKFPERIKKAQDLRDAAGQ